MRSAEPCPACGSPVIRISNDVPDHEYLVNFIARYAACGDCGTLHQIPMPDSCTVTTFYPKMGCYGFGEHYTHHQIPGIPYYHLKATVLEAAQSDPAAIA